MKTKALLLCVLAAAPAAAAEKPSDNGAWLKPSFAGTVGSAGYWKWALAADGGWHEKSAGVDPYGHGSYSDDPFVRKLTLIGGASKDLDKRTSVSGGLGFSAGKVKDVDARGASFELELGAMTDVGPGTAGLDYALSAGNLSVGRYAPAASRPFQAHGLMPGGMHGGAAGAGAGAPVLKSQSYNELSASYKWPFDAFTLVLRETLGLPSYAGPIYTETVGAKVPFGKSWTANASLDADGGSTSGVFLTAGLSYLFD